MRITKNGVDHDVDAISGEHWEGCRGCVHEPVLFAALPSFAWPTLPATEFHDMPRRVVVGANGAYWRDYGDHYSMCIVSPDNDPLDIKVVYLRTDEGQQLVDIEAVHRAFAEMALVPIHGSHLLAEEFMRALERIRHDA